jgi:glutathione peroxidase
MKNRPTKTEPLPRVGANTSIVLPARAKRRGRLLLIGLLAAVGFVTAARAAETAVAPDAACPALLKHTFNRLQTGQPQSLCQFQGKVLLVVNTASYCGYTHQYEGLEAMYRKYKDRGLVVVGFPSNDFSQEPGSNKEVAEFCRTTYGVDFPQFEKSSVAHLSANPLYADLAKRTGASIWLHPADAALWGLTHPEVQPDAELHGGQVLTVAGVHDRRRRQGEQLAADRIDDRWEIRE